MRNECVFIILIFMLILIFTPLLSLEKSIIISWKEHYYLVERTSLFLGKNKKNPKPHTQPPMPFD
jgi:hypothetical protein